MTDLRQKMIDKMLLKGLAAKTQKSYLSSVSLLSRHYNTSPDNITHEQIQDWFLYLVKTKNNSANTCKLYSNGIKFFYTHVLQRPILEFKITTPKRTQHIPDLLTHTEVMSLIEHADNPKYKTIISLTYACGLRVSEVITLQVKDINGESQYLRVRGKGDKDRHIPLPTSALLLLRDYWKKFRPEPYLFSGQQPNTHLNITSIQKYYTRTKARANIIKIGGIHGLRHAYATHQLMAGMPIHVLKEILGHTDITTTQRYLHWTPGVNLKCEGYDLLLPLYKEEDHE